MSPYQKVPIKGTLFECKALLRLWRKKNWRRGSIVGWGDDRLPRSRRLEQTCVALRTLGWVPGPQREGTERGAQSTGASPRLATFKSHPRVSQDQLGCATSWTNPASSAFKAIQVCFSAYRNACRFLGFDCEANFLLLGQLSLFFTLLPLQPIKFLVTIQIPRWSLFLHEIFFFFLPFP